MGILHSMVQLLLEKWDTRGKKKNKPKHLRHTSKTGVSFGRKEKGLCVWAELSHSSDKRYPLPAPNRPINLKTLNPHFCLFFSHYSTHWAPVGLTVSVQT